MSLDIIMAIVSFAMGYSLIPQIILSIKSNKVGLSWQTVIITSVGMWIFVSCYACLQLWVAYCINCGMAILWTLLFALKIFYKEKKNVNLV